MRREGFYWFKCVRIPWRAVCQLWNGEWYTINEAGPITEEELNRRGWEVDEYIGPARISNKEE